MLDRSEASRPLALRALLDSPSLSFLMEAHNGMSAKIVEQTGFSGIWASGLTISAAMGLRDANEASWTQVLDVVDLMVESVSIPLLLDGDTGYGNFNNARRLTKKLCERGVAGVCIEDKVFPKTNSFIGNLQPLADIDEFCGKIAACKDAQIDSKFCVVARIEALISGRRLDEALQRAERYKAAGADAILIHSKRKDASEILAFAEEWAGRLPLVIVPTTYAVDATPEMLERTKVSTVIWANHNLRACVAAMRDVCRTIFAGRTITSIERSVASIDDIFRLTDQDELARAEARYLPHRMDLNGEGGEVTND